jgi:hypothetical protein
MNFLGDVPGVGAFGFGYVAIVMIGMMLIVGPIDWIVLKRLNRQPWTWITTGGWIALLTLGAVYMGYAFKSGDLHFRTLSMIDQTDGMTVGRIDTFGIYSPLSQNYNVKVDPAGWWEPLAPTMYGSGGRSLVDIRFHQDQQGNRPQTMRVNVWNLQLLQSQSTALAPPAIVSDLKVEKRGDVEHIVGTITSHATGTVNLLRIRAKEKIAKVRLPTTGLAPGALVDVDAPLGLSDEGFRFESERPVPGPGGVNTVQQTPVPHQNIWDLAPNRSARVDEMLKSRDDVACIYADAIDVPSVVQLENPGAIEKHWQYIRAIVPLNRSRP